MVISVREYARHAERFGVESVFEAAVRDGVTVGQLAKLYSQLRSIDRSRQSAERAARVRHRIEPVWDLSRSAKHALLTGLLGLGWSNRRIRQTLGISQSTITSARPETVDLDAPRGWHADGGYEAPTPYPDPAL